MSDTKKVRKLIVLSFLIVAVSYFAPVLLDMTGLCTPREFNSPTKNLEGKFDLSDVPLNDCYNISAGIFEPLVVLSFTVFLVSIILNFSKEIVFNSWLRFAKYYLPIAAVLIFLSPTIDSSILGFDREFMTWLFAGVFFVVSLGIIIFKRRSLPNPETTTVKLWK